MSPPPPDTNLENNVGISSANFSLITTVEELLGGWQGKRILELGNQLLRGGEGRRTSKDYFTALGATHVSFDLNGQDGAIPIDLCQPVPEEYWGTFDVVTNFGTSEHIANQEQVFKTVHNCCRVGGYMIHSVPLIGYWKTHCPYYYRDNFYRVLAEGCGYCLISSNVADRFREKLLNGILQKVPTSRFGTALFTRISASIEKTDKYTVGLNNRL